MVSLKVCAVIFFFDLKTNEVVVVDGYENNEEIMKLIRLRNRVKRKRIRNKLNKKIDMLVGR